MTYGTDRWARASEELTPVTTNTRIMVWIIYDIGKLRPVFAGYHVTGFTFSLMFLRCMRKLGVVDPERNTDDTD